GREARASGTPAARVRPQAEERLLRDVLGGVALAEDAAREPDDARQMALDENATGVAIAGADTEHEGFIGFFQEEGSTRPPGDRITHGRSIAVSYGSRPPAAIRRRPGRPPRSLTLTTTVTGVGGVRQLVGGDHTVAVGVDARE